MVKSISTPAHKTAIREAFADIVTQLVMKAGSATKLSTITGINAFNVRNYANKGLCRFTTHNDKAVKALADYMGISVADFYSRLNDSVQKRLPLVATRPGNSTPKKAPVKNNDLSSVVVLVAGVLNRIQQLENEQGPGAFTFWLDKIKALSEDCGGLDALTAISASYRNISHPEFEEDTVIDDIKAK